MIVLYIDFACNRNTIYYVVEIKLDYCVENTD